MRPAERLRRIKDQWSEGDMPEPEDLEWLIEQLERERANLGVAQTYELIEELHARTTDALTEAPGYQVLDLRASSADADDHQPACSTCEERHRLQYPGPTESVEPPNGAESLDPFLQPEWVQDYIRRVRAGLQVQEEIEDLREQGVKVVIHREPPFRTVKLDPLPSFHQRLMNALRQRKGQDTDE